MNRKQSRAEAKRSKLNPAPVSVLWMDVLSLVFFCCTQLLGWWYIGGALLAQQGVALPLTVSALIISWLIADVASGAVHYAADNWGSESTPLIGRPLIAPFRQHHSMPDAILSHNFFERNGLNALGAGVFCAWVPLFKLQSEWTLWLAMTAVFTSGWVALTNQIHAWAHASTPPRLVRHLQRAGILLSAGYHKVHHTPYQEYSTAAVHGKSNSHYCITHGHSEPILRGIIGIANYFLGLLERLGARLGRPPSLASSRRS